MSTPGTAASAPFTSPWTGGRWTWLRTPDRRLLAVAVLVQLALAAIPLHRSYDRTAFEAAGYLVATGRSPYLAADLSAVFHSAVFHDFASIGYPPPWPLLLGALYRLSYALVPDLSLYGLVIKLPTIAAVVALAYLTGAALQNLGASAAAVRRAWLAILFNPFVIYVAAVRGQIDPIVAALALAALLLVASGRRDLSALVLAAAICFKPIAAALLPAVVVVLAATSPRHALRYATVAAAGLVTIYVVPFVALGWDASPFGSANAQMALAGAMSPASVARLWTDPVVLSGHWWLLGVAWVPALVAAVVLARRGATDFTGLLSLGLALTLVFFLLRTWLAETNVVLVLAPALILATLGRLDRRLYAALWALPLALTLLYLWPVKLLWAVAPDAVARAAYWAETSRPLLLAAQLALILCWQVAGWWTVVACLRGRRRSVPNGRPRCGSTAAVARGRPGGRRRKGTAAVRPLFDLGDGLALGLAEPGDAVAPGGLYPTSGLQKGLLLLDGGQELAGEGVGFGVPVLKRGARAVFAGSADVTVQPGPPTTVTVGYVLDRVERLGGRSRSILLLRPLDWAREAFALLYRRVPPLRRALLAASNGIRWLLRVRTRFEPVAPVARVVVDYSLSDEGALRVHADLGELPAGVTEVVLMNELGAEYFDRCVSAGGATATGHAVGAWNRVRETWCRFVCSGTGASFELDQAPDAGIPDARLYRGREVAGGRLGWAGFGYTLSPEHDAFSYEVRFARRADAS